MRGVGHGCGNGRENGCLFMADTFGYEDYALNSALGRCVIGQNRRDGGWLWV